MNHTMTTETKPAVPVNSEIVVAENNPPAAIDLFEVSVKRNAVAKVKDKAIVPDHNDALVKRWHELKRDEGRIEAELAHVKQQIADHASPFRHALSEAAGASVKSVNYGGLTFEDGNRWSAANDLARSSLEAFAGDQFDAMFDTKAEVVVDAKIVKNKAVMDAILAAIGPDDFHAYFRAKRTYKPTAYFTTMYDTIRGFRARVREQLINSGVLKKHAPKIQASNRRKKS